MKSRPRWFAMRMNKVAVATATSSVTSVSRRRVPRRGCSGARCLFVTGLARPPPSCSWVGWGAGPAREALLLFDVRNQVGPGEERHGSVHVEHERGWRSGGEGEPVGGTAPPEQVQADV